MNRNMKLLFLRSSNFEEKRHFNNAIQVCNLLVLHNLVAGQHDVSLGVVIGLGNQSRLVQGFGHVRHRGHVDHSIAAVSSTVSDPDRTHVAHLVVLVQQRVLQGEICKK
jgi:hypothetical protein